jgi:hypothetical protein
MAVAKSVVCHPEGAFSLAPPARAGVRDRHLHLRASAGEDLGHGLVETLAPYASAVCFGATDAPQHDMTLWSSRRSRV